MKDQQTFRTAQARKKHFELDDLRLNGDNLAPLPTTPASSVIVRFCRSWKILLGALIGTLICNILCLPLWTDYGVVGFFRTLLNREARMEIVYAGLLTGAEAFSITSSSEPSLNTLTNYHYDRRGSQFYAANLQIEEEWESYSFTLKVLRKGQIRLVLKGPLKSNDYGEIYSIPADYRNLRIGDKEIFSNWKIVSFAKDFSYRIPVNANDTIKVSFDVRRHPFGADDFNLIHSRNFWYIITLSILTSVIFYILMRHIISQELFKRRKAEDAVFLVIFFLLLAIPMSNVSDAKNCAREGRTLKPCPKVSSVLKEGTNYGKEYDDWFCDHLGGREWFIKLHDIVHRETQRIIRIPLAWYMQDSGWIFRLQFAKVPNPKLVRPIVSNLAELRNFCELNHIKFYVLMVPRKADIYQEELYGYGFDKKKGHEVKVILDSIRHLAMTRHVTCIYPQSELRDARKRDVTFFKLTHHWTDWGAYTGYRALMKEIRRDFPNIPVVSLEDYKLTRSGLIRDEWDRSFHSGWLMRFFNFAPDLQHPPTQYSYYDHKDADRLAFKMIDYTKDFSYGGGAYKIMVLGDSQNENLMGFLSYSASQTRFIRVNENRKLPEPERWKIMKYYKQDILTYKPDILILSLWTPNLFKFLAGTL